ncbi:MAG: phospholipase D-like domain-containing protein [Anaeromyxobacter sp.]
MPRLEDVRALAAGVGVGVGLLLGVQARRWWDRRARSGAIGSLKMGLTGGVDQVGLALAQATSSSLVPGNRVALRENGRLLDALEEDFRAARHSIHVDVYIWKPGQAGSRLAELACRRAREGVAVRILVDPLGSTGFDAELRRPLEAAGCEVRYFRDPRKRPLRLTGRNHRKLVVIDGRVGFTGGFGIAPEWCGDGRTHGWRDTNVEVEGPVVHQMQTSFANHWLETGGALLPRAELERAHPAGEACAAYVTSTDVVGLSHARWVTHIALMAARQRVWIANAYFVPPPEIVGALTLLAQRVPDVRLLLPGPHLDHQVVRWLQHRQYPRLAAAGLRIWEYQPSMLHAKSMLIDDRLVVVGSINLDWLSMELLEEGCLVVDDRPLAAALERCWAADLAHARQVVGEKVGAVSEAEGMRAEG